MTKLAHSHSALKQFEQCPKQYNMQRVTREVKASFGEASIYGNRIHEHLEERLRDKTPLPPESSKFEALCAAFENMPGELLAEQELTLNEKLEITGWWDDDAWFRTKIDVLVLNSPTAVVTDWKTGKHRPDPSQLDLSALQIFKHYPDINEVKASFIWLKDMRIDNFKVDRGQAPALWNTFLGRVKRIEAALEQDNWPARPSGLCPWCPAKHICEFARV